MSNIYLIGYMGSGKSTVGKAIIQTYDKGYALVEMDETIEARENRSINDIFASEGETHFRQLETKLLEEISQKENQIVSTGGGVVVTEKNIEIMKKSGIVVWLKASPKETYNRVCKSTNRPLLNNNMTIEHIEEMMKKREPMYEKASDYTIEVDGNLPKDIAMKVMKVLNKKA